MNVNRRALYTTAFAVIVAACTACTTPAAAPTAPEPDRIATRVAEEMAVAATLTAAAPTSIPPSPVPTLPGATEIPSPASPPTTPPSATPIPPTPTTQPQPTPLPPPPTQPPPPTPPPEEIVYDVIVAGGNTQGLDGEVLSQGGSGAVIADDPTFRNAFAIRMKVRDPNMGARDGAGIERVNFQIRGPSGDVYEHDEVNPFFCVFGGGEPRCNVFVFANNGYRWPQSDNGSGIEGRPPVENGNHSMRIRVYKKGGGDNANWDFNFQIEGVPGGDTGGNPDDSQTTLVVEPRGPAEGSVIRDKFAWRIKVYDKSVGINDGSGVDHVDMYVIGPDGSEVNYEHESATPFCGFDDKGVECVEYVFAANDNKWKNGQPVQNGTHTLRAIAYSKSGAQRQIEWRITIELP